MKKQITLGILGILLSLNFVFAMYSGETEVIQFDDLVKDCEILNNKSNLEGLNMIENGSTVILETQNNYKPDNFTVSCLVRGFREEQSSDGSSWGGSAVADWSAKCGYNLKCLYGSSNITETNQTIILDDVNDTSIDDPVITDDDLSWWRRFVNWLKRLFGR